MVGNSSSNAGGVGSIPGWGAGIPHASWPKNQNIKEKQYCNKFSEDFKNGPHQKKNFFLIFHGHKLYRVIFIFILILIYLYSY